MAKKMKVGDRTIYSFEDLDEWTEAAKEHGLTIKEVGDKGELLADDEDITVHGYFADNWGMLV